MKIDKPTPEDVLHTLMWARALIKRGWTKHKCTNRKAIRSDKVGTRYCAMGAIYATTDDYQLQQAARMALGRALKVPGIAHFNDHRDTKKRDVINLYDRAIECLSQRIKPKKNS